MTRNGKLTYWDLINGHALKEGDKIIIHGWLGRIEEDTAGGGGYYLSIPGVQNGAIFSYLNIQDGRYDFCPEGCLHMGDFPEYDTLENLKKCLIKLYETPFLKVGDIVRIKHKEAGGINYPYCFDAPMATLEGQEFKVVGISDEASNAYVNRPYYNGDIQKYRLDGEAFGWAWHSSMLSLVRRAPAQPEQHNEQQAEQTEPKMTVRHVNVVDDKYEEIWLKDPVTKSKFHIKI